MTSSTQSLTSAYALAASTIILTWLSDTARASIANDGTKFYLLTNKDAPQYKLVSVDLAHPPEQRVFRDVIPEDKDAHLEGVIAVNHNNFVVTYKRNVRSTPLLAIHSVPLT